MAPGLAEWGVPGWRFLHCVSFAYPEAAAPQERQDMFVFLRSVGNVLPCKRCRSHYNAYVGAHLTSSASPILVGRESLARFLVELHNDVNRRLGKSEATYEAVRHEYEVGNDSIPVWIVSVLVMVLVVLAVVFARKRIA